MTLLQSVHVTAAIIHRQRVIKIHIYVTRVPAGHTGYRGLWRMIKGEAFVSMKYYNLPLNDYSDAVPCDWVHQGLSLGRVALA